jgi:hypothetical protein
MTGAALAVAFLIVALGVPEFAASEAAVDPEPVLDPVPQPETLTLTEPETEFAVQPVPEPETKPSDEAAPEPDYEALVEQIFAPNPEPGPAPEPVTVSHQNWYSFWSPFRSELAANGFVSKLQESTGIDYRVVKVKTGIYEVAFAYLDDEDIQEKLARISAATGLDMSDS